MFPFSFYFQPFSSNAMLTVECFIIFWCLVVRLAVILQYKFHDSRRMYRRWSHNRSWRCQKISNIDYAAWLRSKTAFLGKTGVSCHNRSIWKARFSTVIDAITRSSNQRTALSVLIKKHITLIRLDSIEANHLKALPVLSGPLWNIRKSRLSKIRTQQNGRLNAQMGR